MESAENVLDLNPLVATKTVELVDDADSSGGYSRGDTIRYTITLNNSGTTELTGIVVSDTLDENLATTDTNSLTSGTLTAGAAAGEMLVVWDLPALGAAGTETLTFDVTISADTPSRIVVILNQASVSGTGFPESMTDNPRTKASPDTTGFGLQIPRRRGTRR